MTEFAKYKNESGFETEAYVLPEAGEYVIQGSGARILPAGSVLIRLPRPDSYDTVTAKEWEDMGMSLTDPPPAPEPAFPDFDSEPVPDDTGE